MGSLQKELDEARERLSSPENTTEDRTTKNEETIAWWERAVENSRLTTSHLGTLVAENWAAKAQAAISAAKAHEAELAAQAGALARARETQDAAEQATIASQLPLKEAVEALADRDAQLLAVVHRDLEQERHARAVHDSAAATAAPPVVAPAERS